MPESCPTMSHSGWLSGDLSNFHKIKPVPGASSFNPEVLLAETRAPSKHVLQWHYLVSEQDEDSTEDNIWVSVCFIGHTTGSEISRI